MANLIFALVLLLSMIRDSIFSPTPLVIEDEEAKINAIKAAPEQALLLINAIQPAEEGL